MQLTLNLTAFSFYLFACVLDISSLAISRIAVMEGQCRSLSLKDNVIFFLSLRRSAAQGKGNHVLLYLVV